MPPIFRLIQERGRVDEKEMFRTFNMGVGFILVVGRRAAARILERLQELGQKAQKTLDGLGYTNVHFRIGDGYQGWPEAAPFDGIMVTAAPDRVPEPLIDQLKVGGKLVIPVGDFFQDLLVVTRTADGIEQREIIPVRFVPMIGEVEGDKSGDR